MITPLTVSDRENQERMGRHKRRAGKANNCDVGAIHKVLLGSDAYHNEKEYDRA